MTSRSWVWARWGVPAFSNSRVAVNALWALTHSRRLTREGHRMVKHALFERPTLKTLLMYRLFSVPMTSGVSSNFLLGGGYSSRLAGSCLEGPTAPWSVVHPPVPRHITSPTMCYRLRSFGDSI